MPTGARRAAEPRERAAPPPRRSASRASSSRSRGGAHPDRARRARTQRRSSSPNSSDAAPRRATSPRCGGTPSPASTRSGAASPRSRSARAARSRAPGRVAEQVADERVVAALRRAQPREQRRGRGGGRLRGGELLRRPALRRSSQHEAEHAVAADRHRDARPHADVRRVGQPHRRRPPSADPARRASGDVGRRLAGEDRREPHAVERLGVRRVREHAVAAVLERHRPAEPRGQRVDELLQLAMRATLQMSNEDRPRVLPRRARAGRSSPPAWTTAPARRQRLFEVGHAARRRPARRHDAQPAARRADEKAMELASQDAELKAALFRFVDVVPACRSLDDLARHLTGFLGEVERAAAAGRRRDADGQLARRPHRAGRRRGRRRQAHGAPLHRRREPAGGAGHAARAVEGRRRELGRPARRGDRHAGRGRALRRALRRGARDARRRRPAAGPSARRSSATAPARSRARTCRSRSPRSRRCCARTPPSAASATPPTGCAACCAARASSAPTCTSTWSRSTRATRCSSWCSSCSPSRSSATARRPGWCCRPTCATRPRRSTPSWTGRAARAPRAPTR